MGERTKIRLGSGRAMRFSIIIPLRVRNKLQVESVPAGVAMDREGNDSFNLTILSSENEVQPWPKGKKLPKDAPDGCTRSLMGAIEKALRNASNRKGRFIFEPTPGMTFDCVSETQEFYNMYSWEVGFGTKKGDKYGKTMQEFQCQCHGSDNILEETPDMWGPRPVISA
ncbi:hypothetical protein PVAP13_6NG301600 [Panicum virgatum]|uniref:Uncharacterized protein n=1 Tax=Panicum virgatum TaxID=38727 RepID=A0A8T0R4U0_PANVG|nr:hypothetical protein PVAP13_6NG301600 [Panicum virgatum]